MIPGNTTRAEGPRIGVSGQGPLAFQGFTTRRVMVLWLPWRQTR